MIVHVLQAAALASSKEMTIQEGCNLIETYIHERTGRVVIISNPNPKEKFEKAVTRASNYFLPPTRKSKNIFTFTSNKF